MVKETCKKIIHYLQDILPFLTDFIFCFQFSDMLVYTSRTAMPMLQFKVHGQVPLRGMIVSGNIVIPAKPKVLDRLVLA